MPPLKSPNRLWDITLKLVDNLVIRASAAIQELYGSYDNKECRTQIEMFQQYLLSYIPSVVLEQVLNQCQQQRCLNSDNRIWFSIFMHKNMKLLQVQVNIRENRADDAFWIENLKNLGNLVELDLHLVCTDEILEVVGCYCRKLTSVNIMSKVETDIPSGSLLFPFNAMKLKFFVSDEGLRHLSNCQNLRVVTMSSLIRSHCGGRTMSVAGIRQFIKSLPCIQYVSYSDMGVVIADDMDDIRSLPLVRINDSHPQVSHIKAMSRLCPRLQELALTAVYSQTNTVEVLNALRESDLEVEDLELVNFPASDSLMNFIKVKGSFLTRLCLKIRCITFDMVSNIGQFCTNLKHLTLREDYFDRDGPRTDEMLSACGGFRCMFTNLECLLVGGFQWNPRIILPLLLTDAKHLQNLTILCHKDYGYLDDTFLRILRANPMAKLVYIHVNCIIGAKCVREICCCPNLRYFKYIVSICSSLGFIEEIKEEFCDKNYDFKFVDIVRDV
ncbi:hypothetical protein PR048_033551 [Dryococelus australis]|uniref:Uncharacterized protein n=1 Tax=Dryococelus australis TaxID=614101 RepID=A0ABQ9G1U5_9NEOP|nr:hypothetical protein PR048_033551 [Dryococelus australis]